MNNPDHAPAADLSPLRDDRLTYVPEFFAWRGRPGPRALLCQPRRDHRVDGAVLQSGAMCVALTIKVDAFLRSSIRVRMGVSMTLAWSVIAIRRLNDMDRSGWLAVLTFVPFVNSAMGLRLILGSGDNAANMYGPPPCKNSTGLKVACVAVLFFASGYVLNAGITAFGAYKAAQYGFTGNTAASTRQAATDRSGVGFFT